jgi:hypothetical protein
MLEESFELIELLMLVELFELMELFELIEVELWTDDVLWAETQVHNPRAITVMRYLISSSNAVA